MAAVLSPKKKPAVKPRDPFQNRNSFVSSSTPPENADERKIRRHQCRLEGDRMYQLITVLRTHTSLQSVDGQPTDGVALSVCMFEPQSLSSTVAVAGGNMVVRIDCRQGAVVSAYADAEEPSFLALASSVVHSESGRAVPIWAAGGERGIIRVLDTRGEACYLSIAAHRTRIRTLYFSPTHANWLFSGGDDGTVLLWQISSPPDYYGTALQTPPKSTLIAKFDIGDCVFSLAVSPLGDLLLVGTDTSVRLYSLEQIFKSHAAGQMGAVQLDRVAADYAAPQAPVESVVFLNESDVMIRGRGIAQLSMCKLIPQPNGTFLFRRIVCLDWQSAEPKSLSSQQSSQSSSQPSGPSLAFTPRPTYQLHVTKSNRQVLLTGTPTGHIEVFRLPRTAKLIGEPRSPGSFISQIPTLYPSVILKHHQCYEPLFGIAMSKDMRFVVSANANNTVFVWKRHEDIKLTLDKVGVVYNAPLGPSSVPSAGRESEVTLKRKSRSWAPASPLRTPSRKAESDESSDASVVPSLSAREEASTSVVRLTPLVTVRHQMVSAVVLTPKKDNPLSVEEKLFMVKKESVPEEFSPEHTVVMRPLAPREGDEDQSSAFL